eukprot:scaffold157495_cov23-Tisochrysis_lutea.AAC.2
MGAEVRHTDQKKQDDNKRGSWQRAGHGKMNCSLNCIVDTVSPAPGPAELLLACCDAGYFCARGPGLEPARKGPADCGGSSDSRGLCNDCCMEYEGCKRLVMSSDVQGGEGCPRIWMSSDAAVARVDCAETFLDCMAGCAGDAAFKSIVKARCGAVLHFPM